MNELYQALIELQELDREIERSEERLAEFTAELDRLAAPVIELEREVEEARGRLQEMRQKVRRLEQAAEEKRERFRRYQEQFSRARNERELTALQTEIDLVQRAIEADEQEAAELCEQITRTELKVDEVEQRLSHARAEVQPRQEEVRRNQAAAEAELAVLRERRRQQVIRLDPATSRLYERVRSGRARKVLVPLTSDGACGNCFSVVPLQQQRDIRLGRALLRCEVCGVILYPG